MVLAQNTEAVITALDLYPGSIDKHSRPALLEFRAAISVAESFNKSKSI